MNAIKNTNFKQALHADHKKEVIGLYLLVSDKPSLNNPDKPAIVGKLFLKMARSANASVLSAELNIYGLCSGKGTAGGYGYHKASAAIKDALLSAGVKYSKSFGGVGDTAQEEALDLLASHPSVVEMFGKCAWIQAF